MQAYTKAYIPYGGYYSSPFSRWQGSMQYDNAVSLGANTARRWFLEKRGISPTVIDYLFFGATVAQNHWFVSHNWAAAILTDDEKLVPGLFINEGVTPTTAEGLAKLKPQSPGGVLSFGAQTFPADGNCGIIVTTREKAKKLSTDPGTEIHACCSGARL